MRRMLVVLASIPVVIAPMVTVTAQAASSCAWHPASATLEVSSNLGTADRLVVSGTDILLNGVSCDQSATTVSVDTITLTVLPVPEPAPFILDLGGGGFEPGATAEGSGTSEIEFVVDGVARFLIDGNAASDVITLGANGLNLNADDDIDLTYTALPYIDVFTKGGPDRVDASGDPVVGGPFPKQLVALGGGGSDVLRGGSDSDYLIGGRGDDDIASAVGPEGDSLAGGPGDDSIVGGPWIDEILGNDGNDTIDGRGRADDLFGGVGVDVVTYAEANAGVIVDLRLGTVESPANNDHLAGFEVVTGSSFADALAGNDGGNVLQGGGGNDVLNGRNGWDRLLGGFGRDRVSFEDAPSGVSVNLAIGEAVGWGIDALEGIESSTGSQHHDDLIGNIVDNQLSGLRGSDFIRGGSGADALRGGRGIDRLLGGAGDDGLRGGAGRDLLHGDAGNDSLDGGPGMDACYQDGGSGQRISCELPASGSARQVV